MKSIKGACVTNEGVTTSEPKLDKRQNLVTVIPDSRSGELEGHMKRSVSSFFGVAMQVFATEVGGGVVLDVYADCNVIGFLPTLVNTDYSLEKDQDGIGAGLVRIPDS